MNKRFRNITPVEADVQYIMKALWSSCLMRIVSERLNNGQNALKGRATQSFIISHRIALDKIFMRDKSAIIIKNDAVNYYCWILMHVL